MLKKYGLFVFFCVLFLSFRVFAWDDIVKRGIGSGGGPLYGDLDFNGNDIINISEIKWEPATTDILPSGINVTAQDAYEQATGANQDAGAIILREGIGTRRVAIDNWNNCSLDTVTVKVSGINNILTENTQWFASVDNATTAISLASAIDALSGVDAYASGSIVYINRTDKTVTQIWLGESDATCTTVLMGDDGGVSIAGDLYPAQNNTFSLGRSPNNFWNSLQVQYINATSFTFNSGNSNLYWNGKTRISAPNDGDVKISNNIQSQGINIDIHTTADTMTVRNFADDALGNISCGALVTSSLITANGGIGISANSWRAANVYQTYGGNSGGSDFFLKADEVRGQMLFSVGSESGNQIVTGSSSYWNTTDFDHPPQTDPTWFLHSIGNPDTDNSICSRQDYNSLSSCEKTQDSAPLDYQVMAGSAYEQASSNKDGANLYLTAGRGTKEITVIDYTNFTAGEDVTIYCGGTTYECKEGTDFDCITSNDVCATNLASCFNAFSGFTSSSSSAAVYVAVNSTVLGTCFILSDDDANINVTDNPDGNVIISGNNGYYFQFGTQDVLGAGTINTGFGMAMCEEDSSGCLVLSSDSSLNLHVSRQGNIYKRVIAEGFTEQGASVSMTAAGIGAESGYYISWSTTTAYSGPEDLRIGKIGNGDFYIEESTKNPRTGIYIDTESVTFNAAPGESSKATTGSIIKAGAFVIGISGRVTTGNTGGCTGMDIGIAGKDTDAFGDGIAVTLNTTFTHADGEAGANWGTVAAESASLDLIPSMAAQEITVTAIGGDGNCDDMVVALTVHYFKPTAADTN